MNRRKPQEPTQDTTSASVSAIVPDEAALRVSPFYHAARNEITRPDQTTFCSAYFVQRWMPRLGPLATTIAIAFRESCRTVAHGEASLQISQAVIARRVGCSVRSLQRELTDNADLQRFVRTEERFARNERGRVRQTESVYRVAMDDPLVPEDEPRLQEIIARRAEEAARYGSGKVIVPDPPTRSQDPLVHASAVVRQSVAQEAHVVRQFDVQHHEAKQASLYDNLSPESLYESIKDRIDSESPQGGAESRFAATESAEILHSYLNECQQSKVDEWRKMNEETATMSCKMVGDTIQASIGFHVRVWNHARLLDRAGKTKYYGGEVSRICASLRETREQTGRPQGAAFTRRVKKLFQDAGVPLPVRDTPVFDETEIAAVRAALANAPFMKSAAE